MMQPNGQPLVAWPGSQVALTMEQIKERSAEVAPIESTLASTETPEAKATRLAAEKASKKAQKDLEKEARRNWETPDDRFAPWNAEFGFTIDLAANEKNHKCDRWIGPGSPLGIYDAMVANLALPGEGVWCNAPGFDWEFVKLGWRLMGGAAQTRPRVVVNLRPTNQTDQPIWQELVEQYRDWNGYQLLQSVGIDFRVRFLSPRVEHIPPPGIKASTPLSGHCLLIWRNLWMPQAAQ